MRDRWRARTAGTSLIGVHDTNKPRFIDDGSPNALQVRDQY